MTVSELERVGIKKRNYNGLGCYEIAKCPINVAATVSYNETRELWKDVVFTIDRTEHSYKYGDEVQFVVYTKVPPVIQKRASNDNWCRIEIAIPLKIAEKMLEKALQKLWSLPEE